jgi:large subunit ribosomal protein L21
MYAVIETGGKQYRVSPGDSIQVEKLSGEVGSEVEFGRVLAVSNDSGALTAGGDVTNAKVKGAITAQDRAGKVIVFKFKRKKQYKKTQGHRQYQTTVRIDEILA